MNMNNFECYSSFGVIQEEPTAKLGFLRKIWGTNGQTDTLSLKFDPMQGQSEPGEQHPVTEDWKENVL